MGPSLPHRWLLSVPVDPGLGEQDSVMASSAQKEPRRPGRRARCQLLREVFVPESTLWWEGPPPVSTPTPYPQEESSDVPEDGP